MLNYVTKGLYFTRQTAQLPQLISAYTNKAIIPLKSIYIYSVFVGDANNTDFSAICSQNYNLKVRTYKF